MIISFESIESNHLPKVKLIYDWYIKNSTATFHTEPITLDQLQEFIFIGHPLYKSFLIYADGALAGYCFLTYHKKRPAYDRTAEITIYLKQEAAGKGIGKSALAYLEQVAKEAGLKNLVGVITGDNTPSMALFERAGFEKCAHFKNVGEKFGKVLDVVAYQKQLG
ncbi:MAG TPA: N-acetyltransferase family protein [Cyclobacteriaceae bacterium]|nr:N-acetyltransferase family protein [Cyclobacteriaceae bacterium]HRJ82448.1 N-acetyltransferase family protein [Cyclobacteriaceae bacterium]